MNIDQTKKMFKDIVKRVKFEPGEMLKFANIVAEERKAHFARHEGPDGEPWKPLKMSTIMQKMGAHKTTRVVHRNGISGLGTGKVKSWGRRMSAMQKREAQGKGVDYSSINPTAPLIDTGALMKVTSKATATTAHVVLARSRGENVGPGYSISEIHDKGMGHVPQRRHWGIPQKAVERILKERDRLVEKKVKEIIAEYKR